ncbi:hypothetical protein BG004_004982 [Podila humilis]|nr:hypothetical protein BG004_004982 [Podila humilis]
MEQEHKVNTRSSCPVGEKVGQTSTGKMAMSEVSAGLMSFKPLGGICESFCGLHLYPNEPQRQLIAYHYCHCIDEDRYQCLMYDSDSRDAKLMGVEYIISEKLFKSLPVNEKKYWHSHKYEVESGLLVAVAKPMVPEAVASKTEHTPLKTLVNTYGKIWQTWPVDNAGRCTDTPMGPAQLLFAFTKDGQVNQDLLARRDKEMGISTEQKRRERTDIVGNTVADGADQPFLNTGAKAWQVYDHGDKGVVGTSFEKE